MISVLLEGTLVATPVSRTTTAGKLYVTASMRASGEDGVSTLCSLIAFDTTVVAALAGLVKGDSVAVAGHAALSQWDKDGAHRVGLKVTATQVLTVYDAGKRRGRKEHGAST